MVMGTYEETVIFLLEHLKGLQRHGDSCLCCLCEVSILNCMQSVVFHACHFGNQIAHEKNKGWVGIVVSSLGSFILK